MMMKNPFCTQEKHDLCHQVFLSKQTSPVVRLIMLLIQQVHQTVDCSLSALKGKCQMPHHPQMVTRFVV